MLSKVTYVSTSEVDVGMVRIVLWHALYNGNDIIAFGDVLLIRAMYMVVPFGGIIRQTLFHDGVIATTKVVPDLRTRHGTPVGRKVSYVIIGDCTMWWVDGAKDVVMVVLGIAVLNDGLEVKLGVRVGIVGLEDERPPYRNVRGDEAVI